MIKKINELTRLADEIGVLDISITGSTKVGVRLGAYIYNNYGDGMTKDYEINDGNFGFYLALDSGEVQSALEEIAELFKGRRSISVTVDYFGDYGPESIDFI